MLYFVIDEHHKHKFQKFNKNHPFLKEDFYNYDSFTSIFKQISEYYYKLIDYDQIPVSSNKKYFYLITDYDALNSSEEKILYEVKNKKYVYLLFFHPNEPIGLSCDKPDKDRFLTFLKRIDIPKNKVYFVTGLLTKNNKQIKNNGLIIFDRIQRNYFDNLVYNQSIIKKERPYYFLYLVRKFRWHRIYLLKNVLDINSEKHLYTFNKEYNSQLDVKLFQQEVNNDKILNKFLNKNNEIDFSDITLNKDNKNPFNMDLDLFNKAYINIIHESFNFNDTVFLTEKTFKPILAKQMFLINGGYRFNKTLKEIGYKTFDNILQESYDDIKDSQERINVLVKEIKRLSMLPPKKMHKIWLQNQDKIDHNYDNIMKTTETNEFINRIKNILY